jgi:hypothetical protein
MDSRLRGNDEWGQIPLPQKSNFDCGANRGGVRLPHGFRISAGGGLRNDGSWLFSASTGGTSIDVLITPAQRQSKGNPQKENLSLSGKARREYSISHKIRDSFLSAGTFTPRLPPLLPLLPLPLLVPLLPLLLPLQRASAFSQPRGE